MPTYIIKGVKCTLKDGVVKLATEYCNLCNYKKDMVNHHYHSCKYCKLNIDEVESNIIHFAYAEHDSWRHRWFAHSQCYKGKKTTVNIINYKDKK